VFEKFEEVAVGDRSHPNHLRKRVKQPVAAQSGCRRGWGRHQGNRASSQAERVL